MSTVLTNHTPDIYIYVNMYTLKGKGVGEGGGGWEGGEEWRGWGWGVGGKYKLNKVGHSTSGEPSNFGI